MPAVRVRSGSWLAITVLDHRAGVQLPSAHMLPGAPTRHSHSMCTSAGDARNDTGCSRESCSASLPLTENVLSTPSKEPLLYTPVAAALPASPVPLPESCRR